MERSWIPRRVAYETGIAHELCDYRYSHCDMGFTSIVYWAVGKLRLQTEIVIKKDDIYRGSPVTVCKAAFLTDNGWTHLTERPPETISGEVPDYTTDDFDIWLHELERSLIQDAMRILDGCVGKTN